MIQCRRCGRETSGEQGPIVALLAHYEAEHGGVPKPKYHEPVPPGMEVRMVYRRAS